MALTINNNDAWVLSPYCFCADQPWLLVNDLVDAEDEVQAGGGLTPIPGLSAEDTALLAALLTALGILLFLLLLLLCLFCPCGLCCRKKGRCCSKDRKKKTSSKGGLNVPYVGGGKSVNLTAVDMKIPRAWTDDDFAGFSDSELDKRRQIWTDKDSGRWLGYGEKYGLHNKAFGEAGFKDDGWQSSYRPNNSYGGVFSGAGLGGWGRRSKGNKREMVALDGFYRGSGESQEFPSERRDKSQSTSHGNVVEKQLMTPRTPITNFSTHNNIAASSYGNNTTTSSYGNSIVARDAGNHGYAYTGRRNNENGDQTIMTSANLDIMKSKHISDVTSDRDTSKTAINTVHALSRQDNNGLAESMNTVSVVGAERGVPISQHSGMNHVTTTSLTRSDNVGDLVTATDVLRESSVPSYTIVEEKSTYMKRVVEETETVSTS